MWPKIKAFFFQNQTPGQTAAKNSFWLAVSNMGGRFLRSFIIIYAARLLGAEQWGVFSYAITLVAFLTFFIDLGLGHILLRELVKAETPERKKQLISTTFVVKLCLTALGVMAIVFLAPLFATIEGAKVLLPIMAFIFVFDSLREFGFSVNRAFERMEVEAGLFLFTNLAIVLFGFGFLLAAPTVTSFTVAYAIGTGVGMAVTYGALRKHLGGLFAGFASALVRPIFRSAWPFALSALLGMLMINTDILILGWLRSAEEVGFYSAGYRVIQLLYLIPTILATSMLPAFARLAVHDHVRMRQILEQAMHFAFLLAIPLAVGGVIVAGPLITFLFGSSYAPAALSFQILLLTLLVDFPAVLLSNAVFSYDRQKHLVIYSAIGGFLNVGLDLFLIPRWGIAGAAAATLVAQFASNVYLWALMKRINNFRVLPGLKKALGAGLAMGAATSLLAFLEAPVLATIAAGALVYLGILFLLKEPLVDEIRLILRPAASPPVDQPLDVI